MLCVISIALIIHTMIVDMMPDGNSEIEHGEQDWT